LSLNYLNYNNIVQYYFRYNNIVQYYLEADRNSALTRRLKF